VRSTTPAASAEPIVVNGVVFPDIDVDDSIQIALFRTLNAQRNDRDASGQRVLKPKQIAWMVAFQIGLNRRDEALRAQQEHERELEDLLLQLDQQEKIAHDMHLQGKSDSDILAAAPKATTHSIIVNECGIPMVYDCDRGKLGLLIPRTAIARRFSEPGRSSVLIGKGMTLDPDTIREVHLFQVQWNATFNTIVMAGSPNQSSLPANLTPTLLERIVTLPAVVDKDTFEVLLGIKLPGEHSLSLKHCASPGFPIDTYVGLDQAVENLVALLGVIFGAAVCEPFQKPILALLERAQRDQRFNQMQKPIYLAWVFDGLFRRFWTTLRFELRNSNGELVVLSDLGWVQVWQSSFLSVSLEPESVKWFSTKYESSYAAKSSASKGTTSRLTDKAPRSGGGPSSHHDDRDYRGDDRDYKRRRWGDDGDRPSSNSDRRDQHSDRRPAQSDRRDNERRPTSDRHFNKKMCLTQLASVVALGDEFKPCTRGESCKFVHKFSDVSRDAILHDIEINSTVQFSSGDLKRRLQAAVNARQIGRV
jgi:hypothetical protein